jgi:hypothetical protein
VARWMWEGWKEEEEEERKRKEGSKLGWALEGREKSRSARSDGS